MMTCDPRASSVFEKDVEDTYAHIARRVEATKAEEAEAAAGEGETVVVSNAETGEVGRLPCGEGMAE